MPQLGGLWTCEAAVAVIIANADQRAANVLHTPGSPACRGYDVPGNRQCSELSCLHNVPALL